MRKPKVIAGFCLMAQALLFMILFFVYWSRSKSLSRSLALLSAVSGAGGAWLILTEQRAKRRSDAMNADFCGEDEDLGDELEECFDGDVNCAFGENEVGGM